MIAGPQPTGVAARCSRGGGSNCVGVVEVSNQKALAKVPERVISQFCVIDQLCGSSNLEGKGCSVAFCPGDHFQVADLRQPRGTKLTDERSHVHRRIAYRCMVEIDDPGNPILRPQHIVQAEVAVNQHGFHVGFTVHDFTNNALGGGSCPFVQWTRDSVHQSRPVRSAAPLPDVKKNFRSGTGDFLKGTKHCVQGVPGGNPTSVIAMGSSDEGTDLCRP